MPTPDNYGQGVQLPVLADGPNAQTIGTSIGSVVPQTVMRFASAAGRAAVLTGAEAPVPGMVGYLVAEDRFEGYTSGQGWVPLTPGPWIPLTLASGYVANDAAPAFRLINGSVELRGQIAKSDGTVFVNNTPGYVIANLGTGYKPADPFEGIGATELAINYYCRQQITPDGAITVYIPTGGTPHWVGLDNIRFSTT